MNEKNDMKYAAVEDYTGVWVIGELLSGRISDSTRELLSEGRKLADKKECTLSLVLLGDNIEPAVREASFFGMDRVIFSDSPRFSGFREEVLSREIVRLIRKYKPDIVLGSATARGRSLMPRIAVTCGTGLTADCTSLDIDPETGLLLQTRPAFGGNLIATIKTENHRPQMATVRPHVFEQSRRNEDSPAEIIGERAEEESVLEQLKTVLSETPGGSGTGTFSNSHIIITGGRGVRGKEGFDLLREFAELTGAALGATRAAVDLGWIPHEHQIGQTGETVRSKIYIACGVSGQIQHLVGMQNSDCIISINIDRDAPIMELADIAIVGDLFDVIPEMIAFVRRARGITSGSR